MTAPRRPLELGGDGAQLFPRLAAPLLAELDGAMAEQPEGRAGWRIAGHAAVARLIGPSLPIGAAAGAIFSRPPLAVRAILFDKSPAANWSLDWHQDRTIAVAARIPVAGFARWNTKQGICHVEPPFALIERMLTVRIHLDPADESNGALEVVAGSHRLGRVEGPGMARAVEQGCAHLGRAERGDVWFYSTPIIHRSASSAGRSRRRVLQVDYSGDTLPGGLEWRGV